MIHSLTIINSRSEVLSIELTNPEKSGFQLLEITGLTPPKADIQQSEVLSTDGGIFTSARIGQRDIELRIGLSQYPTSVEDGRLYLYKMFPNKDKVVMVFTTDNREAFIEGYVEHVSAPIFTKAQVATISMVCPFPYFKSVSNNSVVFSGYESLFEFPFANESLTEDLISFGNIKNNTEQTIYYTGDAETGLTISMYADGAVGDITLYNTKTRESATINTTTRLNALTGSPMVAGDEIILTTTKGEKSVYLVRGGFYYNIFNCLDWESDWFSLETGDNLFAFTATFGSEFLKLEASHNILYGGL